MLDARERKRKEKEKESKKKSVEFCLYCGLNVAKPNSLYCSETCAILQAGYEEWLRAAPRRKHD
jgi:hypothetical protein